MRLFKKLFSIGSKRFKKRSQVDPCTEPPVQDYLRSSYVDDTEAALSRLLRSSSGRCTTEPQTSLGSLPPLPHPIDSVVPPPKSSTTTIASVSARSTYSVVVRSRTVHSRTEFPNAYPPMDVSFTPKRSLADSGRRRSKSVPITPRDKSRLLALRQDPSVASILNHYDDEGHLDSALFSNSPSPREGCVQRRRTGSTLRQLLGHPSSPDLRNSGAEGDISWAEKFLGDTDRNSSVSSLGPQTPADTHFTYVHPIDDQTSLSINCDTLPSNHPTFSSLEVELSVATDPDLTHSQAPNSPYGDSMSPQRASQVFRFLGDKKRAHGGPVSRLPQLKTTASHCRRYSAESSNSDTKQSHISRPYTTHIPQPTSPSQRRYSLASDGSRSPPASPTTVVFSPQLKHEESTAVHIQHTGQSSRCPRQSGSRIPSRQSTGPVPVSCGVGDSYSEMEQPLPMPSVLSERLNADYQHISVSTARPREMRSQIPKLRTPSGSSSGSAESKHDSGIGSACRHPICLQPGVQMKPRPIEAELQGKENDISRLPQPLTPIRPFGIYSYHLREAPSPTSSSELSPVGKQMMANLRQQRMNARQRERQAGRLGSGQSRIRY